MVIGVGIALLLLRRAFNNLHLQRLLVKKIPLNPPLQKGDFTYSPLWEGGSGRILDADPIAGTSYPIVNNIVLRVVTSGFQTWTEQ
jgi:hypothetical protein